MVLLYSHLSRERADIYSLVLSSSGIGNRVTASDAGFRLEVPHSLVEEAQDAISRYELENPALDEKKAAKEAHGRMPIPVSGIAISLLLLAVHVAVINSTAPRDYIHTFGADAGRILRGEIYRCATALLLHADASHIAGNIAGILLFGSAICVSTGAGVGWLMMLVCGVLGNWINAFAHDIGHLSVGASTSVFGAVGILCALQAATAKRTGKGWKRVGMALGGGMALLGFLGTSARSDIGAHLFGFFLGVLTGTVYGWWGGKTPGKGVQLACGTIAISILLIAWIQGVRR